MSGRPRRPADGDEPFTGFALLLFALALLVMFTCETVRNLFRWRR